MEARPNGIVTLMTDLGTVDGYVAAMKGSLLGANPRATLVDVTHHIPARDVTEAAFQIATVWSAFPSGTTHVIVVDAGLDSEAQPVAVEAGDQFFIVPNNGLLTLLAANQVPSRVVSLDREELFRADRSTTFPGRDIYAPVAGAFSSGSFTLDNLGSSMRQDALVSLPWSPIRDSPTRVHAPVVSIDRFGNCRTLITRRHLPEDMSAMYVRCGDITVRGIHRSYRDVPEGKTMALFGSHGGLEVAVRGGSAAVSWEIRRGDEVEVYMVEGSSM